jgi:hypothetical protein
MVDQNLTIGWTKRMRLIYVFLALASFWSIFLTLVFRLEKRTSWPYSDPEPVPPFPDPLGYATRWADQAMRLGFKMLGWSRDLKGERYRVNYAMLVSPEADVFAVVGSGTVMKMPVTATWLYTPTADGRTFYTTDKQSGVQIDLSGNWVNQLAASGDFGRLLQRHREWLKSAGVMPRGFTAGRELEELKAVREQHFRSMERAGLIRFTDGTARDFFYTTSGAARTAIWGYFVGMARQLSQGRFPRTA